MAVPVYGHQMVSALVLGLVLGALYTIFQPGPVGTGPGARFGWKPAEIDEMQSTLVEFPSRVPLSYFLLCRLNRAFKEW